MAVELALATFFVVFEMSGDSRVCTLQTAPNCAACSCGVTIVGFCAYAYTVTRIQCGPKAFHFFLAE